MPLPLHGSNKSRQMGFSCLQPNCGRNDSDDDGDDIDDDDDDDGEYGGDDNDECDGDEDDETADDLFHIQQLACVCPLYL